jgi:hypothetical protein
MTWLERVRQKNFTPNTLGSDKSDESLYGSTSVTFGTAATKDGEVFVEAPQWQPSATIIVTYQRIWFDYDLRDGTYTPAELQQAKLLVKRGPVLRYRLRWPGGTPQPIDVAVE